MYNDRRMSSDAKTRCLETLKNDILTKQLAPGALLDEIRLADRFGISRTPLREIIQRLSGEGYLVVEQNRGAKVAPMDFETIRHFFQAAPMIYAAVSRLAAEQAQPADLARLKKIQKAYRSSIKSGDASRTAMENHRFHLAIGEIAGSPYLLPSMKRLLIDHTRIGQTFYQNRSKQDQKRISAAADQHDDLIAAFEANATAQAVEITLEHWALSRDRMDAFVSPDPLAFELEEAKNAV